MRNDMQINLLTFIKLYSRLILVTMVSNIHISGKRNSWLLLFNIICSQIYLKYCYIMFWRKNVLFYEMKYFTHTHKNQCIQFTFYKISSPLNFTIVHTLSKNTFFQQLYFQY